MDFKTAFKFPLKMDGFGSKVFTKDNDMAFDFMESFMTHRGENILIISKPEQKKIVEIINGNSEHLFQKINGKLSYSKESSTIFIEINGVKKMFISIRGWGHLTGVGGLKLQPEVAKKLQDEFADYIIEKLS